MSFKEILDNEAIKFAIYVTVITFCCCTFWLALNMGNMLGDFGDASVIIAEKAKIELNQ